MRMRPLNVKHATSRRKSMTPAPETGYGFELAQVDGENLGHGRVLQ